MEIASGVSYSTQSYKVNLDYRFLQWSTAHFLNSVGWNDQHVVAIGFDGKVANHSSLRVGFNQSTKLIENKMGTNGFDTVLVSNKKMIKLAGDAFATTSALGLSNRHFTFGSSHRLSEFLTLDTAMVYMDQGSLSRSGYFKTPLPKQYGWEARFQGKTYQVEMIYIW